MRVRPLSGPLRPFEAVRIERVLRPAGRALVQNQMAAPDNRQCLVAVHRGHAIRPGLLEVDPYLAPDSFNAANRSLKSGLIATVSLEGEIVERQVPDGLEPLGGGQASPERAIEAAVVGVEGDEPAGPGAPAVARLHTAALYSGAVGHDLSGDVWCWEQSGTTSTAWVRAAVSARTVRPARTSRSAAAAPR